MAKINMNYNDVMYLVTNIKNVAEGYTVQRDRLFALYEDIYTVWKSDASAIVLNSIEKNLVLLDKNIEKTNSLADFIKKRADEIKAQDEADANALRALF